MKKSLWTLISILMVAALGLAACTPAATATTAPTSAPANTQPPADTAAPQPTSAPEATVAPTSGAAVKITIWHQWDGTYLEAIQAAFDDYTKAHPNVTIDL